MSLFLALELALVWPQLLGASMFAARAWRQGRRVGVSGTAYEPLLQRLILDAAGTRPDSTAPRLAPHLPALSRSAAGLLAGTLGGAARLSGYRGSLFSYPPSLPSTMSTLIGHRTWFFDRAITNAFGSQQADTPGQLVILGAGWDTRAYREWSRELRIFELDRRPTQLAKREALERGTVPSGHITFVELDLNRGSWLEALKAAGFDRAIPTFVLWEGVTMYLDENAVRVTLQDVARLAPGSLLAFDYLSRELLQAEPPLALAGRAIHRTVRFYNETLRFGLPTRGPARGQLIRFLARDGLELVESEPYAREGGRKSLGGVVLAKVATRA